jgi:hypothetical protein
VRDRAIVPIPPATGNRKIALAAIAFVTCCRSRRTGARANTKMKPRFKAGDTVVWVNLASKIYHFAGYDAYGNTTRVSVGRLDKCC